MPLVLVTMNRTRFPGLTDDILELVGNLLTARVASTLTCDDPGGKLAPKDIVVRFQERSPMDREGEQYALEIVVFANDFPSRRTNLEERCCELQDYLRKALKSHFPGYVWILLSPAAFAEF